MLHQLFEIRLVGHPVSQTVFVAQVFQTLHGANNGVGSAGLRSAPGATGRPERCYARARINPFPPFGEAPPKAVARACSTSSAGCAVKPVRAAYLPGAGRFAPGFFKTCARIA